MPSDLFPRVSVNKSSPSFADIERRHAVMDNVSGPSTDPISIAVSKFIFAKMNPDYSPLKKQIGPAADDLLDPPDSYPFWEWEDFTDDQRAVILTCRVAWAVEFHKHDIAHGPMGNLALELKDIGAKEREDTYRATGKAARALESALRATDRLKRDTNPTPARPGHMMAEGNSLAKAKDMVKGGSAYARKVQFLEPVNAYTMLYNDRIAVGGDMLTACTITDTVEHQIKGYDGKMKTVHTAKAVSL